MTFKDIISFFTFNDHLLAMQKRHSYDVEVKTFASDFQRLEDIFCDKLNNFPY